MQSILADYDNRLTVYLLLVSFLHIPMTFRLIRLNEWYIPYKEYKSSLIFKITLFNVLMVSLMDNVCPKSIYKESFIFALLSLVLLLLLVTRQLRIFFNKHRVLAFVHALSFIVVSTLTFLLYRPLEDRLFMLNGFLASMTIFIALSFSLITFHETSLDASKEYSNVFGSVMRSFYSLVNIAVTLIEISFAISAPTDISYLQENSPALLGKLRISILVYLALYYWIFIKAKYQDFRGFDYEFHSENDSDDSLKDNIVSIEKFYVISSKE